MAVMLSPVRLFYSLYGQAEFVDKNVAIAYFKTSWAACCIAVIAILRFDNAISIAILIGRENGLLFDEFRGIPASKERKRLKMMHELAQKTEGSVRSSYCACVGLPSVRILNYQGCFGWLDKWFTVIYAGLLAVLCL